MNAKTGEEQEIGTTDADGSFTPHSQNTYQISRDDIGLLVRVTYLPVRVDGAQGTLVYATTSAAIGAGM